MTDRERFVGKALLAVFVLGLAFVVIGGFLTIARLRGEVPPRCQMKHYAMCRLPHDEGYIVDCDDPRIYCDDEGS